MVDQRQVVRMRAIADGYLTQRCEIEQEQMLLDGYGAMLHSWQVVASDVRCRVIQERRTGSQMVESGNQETMREMYRLIVPMGVVLRADQRVRVDGALYTVVSAEDALTDVLQASGTIVRVRE
jgi:Phage head-tail joining protein.